MASPEVPSAAESLIAAAVERWALLWEVPSLRAFAHVRFSARLRRTRGRSTPATGRVVLSASLLNAPQAELLSVLCHELAHVTAALRYGAHVRPHGLEWTALVERAGYAAVTYIASTSTQTIERAKPESRYPFVHVCPVCHTRRYARRPVSRWRCAECVAAGLAGELVVSRVTETTTPGRAYEATQSPARIP